MVKESQPYDRLDHANPDPWWIHWWISRSLPTSHHRYDSTPIPLSTHTLLPKHINMDMIKKDHLGSYLNQETKSQYICWALDNHAIHQIIQCGSHFLPSNSPVITHLTTATELAITTEKAKPKPLLPPEYAPYASVFLKEATDHVPPSCSYDHEINLDKTFKPKICKVYSLSPEERKVTEDFLDENLRTGKIHPSNSPQVSPFFFIKKNHGGLCPCQDYHYINEHTVCDTYPFHSLLTSLINSKEWKSSPNLTSNGDTTMSESRMDINGKPLSSLIKDSLNQPWCSLVSPIPLPPSNDSWMIPFTIWLQRNGSSSTWMTSLSTLLTLPLTLNELNKFYNTWSNSIFTSNSRNVPLPHSK